MIRYIALSLFCFSTAWSASVDKRLTQLEKEMLDVSMETAIGTYGARFAQPIFVDGYGWSICFDLLYWQGRAGGTDYAFTSKSAFAPIEGETKEQHFDWDFGLRAGIGYQLPDSAFDLSVVYTWYSSPSSDSSAKDQPSLLYFLKSPLIFQLGQVAKSSYKVSLNSFDINLGDAYFISSHLQFHPYLGVQATWLEQRQKVRYYDVVDPGVYDLVEVHNNDFCRFSGFGPQFGVDSRWYLGSGWSLYSVSSGALLWGEFNVHQSHSINSATNPASTTDLHYSVRAKTHAYSPFIRAGLGFLWDHYFKDNEARIAFSAGYEVLYFWRQNQTIEGSGTLHDGEAATGIRFTKQSEDLSFSGLTLQFRLDF